MRNKAALAIILGVVTAMGWGPSRALGSGTLDFEFPSIGSDFAIGDEDITIVPFFVTNPPIDFVQSVELDLLGLSHENAADLDMFLISPTGLNIEIMTDIGGNNPISSLDLFFTDGGATLPAAPSPLPSGTYQPEGLAALRDSGFQTFFNKSNPVGSWLLLIIDDAANDTGTLESATLRITVPEPMTLSLLAVGGLLLAGRRRKIAVA